MLTREQRYAQAVYELVAQKAGYSKTDKQKYGTMAHNLPVLIRSAGLVQALVFVDSRSEDAQKQLLKDLEQVLRKIEVLDANVSLLEHSYKAKISEYMLLTEHALAALLWFKRYAQSVLEVEGGE